MVKKSVSVKPAIVLLAFLLLAPVGTVVAQALRGLLVYGHEVHTLQSCGDAHTFWVRAPAVGHRLATA